MDFQLKYTGDENDLVAHLYADSKLVASEYVKDAKAARKWARREARDYKLENTPEATEYHSVSIVGSATFTL